MNPGMDYNIEQRKKLQGYQNKMKQKELIRPKKIYKFKVKISGPIRSVGKKREKLNIKYSVERKEYLEIHPICEVVGCTCEATEIHHKMGKIGYADQWARDNDIPLLIDKRFFLAVHHEHHRKIEDKPEWAKENGYSVERLKNLDL